MPTVSVIIPTKNRHKLLEEAVKSIQAQTLEDWECLIVDDGSTDGTEEFMTSLMVGDPRFQYQTRQGELAGANVCRNQGIRASTGEFVIFLDSDDVLSPTCLEVRTQHLHSHVGLDFMVFQAGTFKERIGDSGALWHPFTPGDDLSRFLQCECVWDITGPIWRRSVFERIGVFDETLRSMQDYELHIRILAAQCPYVKVKIVDHYIRGHGFDQKTSHLHFRSPEYIRAAEVLPGRILRVLHQNQLTTWSRVRFIQGVAFSMAENWVKIGKHREARRSWRNQRELGVETHLYLMGLIALNLLRVSSDPNSIAQRIVNKWKGLVRFRQEPLVLNYKARS